MIALGLDLGRQLGWALWDKGDGIIAYGEINLGAAEDERYAVFMRFMEDQFYLSPAPYTHVCFEDVQFFRGGAASKQNAGYRAIVMGSCCEQGIPYAGVGTGTLKQYATRHGGADKSDMIKAAQPLVRKLQRGRTASPLTDNMADAIFCARYGATQLEW